VTNPTTTPSLAVAAGIVPTANGGTGATTAAQALANLGGAAISGQAFTGPISAPSINGNSIVGEISLTGYGGVGDGITNNDAAFASAIAAIPTKGCLVISPGVYAIQTSLTLPSCMRGIGNPSIKYTGSSTTYVMHMGYVYGYYLGQIIIDGNGLASYGLEFDSTLDPTVDRVKVTNVTVAGFRGAYVQNGHFIQPTVSRNSGAFTTVPVNCMVFDTATSSDNKIDDLICDHVSGAGILGDNLINSTFIGGTSEGNATGIDCEGGTGQNCSYNHFITMDVEVNTTDIVINGPNAGRNTFTAMSSGFSSTNGVTINASTGNSTGNMFIGGSYGSVVLGPNAYLTKLIGFTSTSCPTDNGFKDSMTGIQGGVTLCPDETPFAQNFNGAVTVGGTLATNGVANFFTTNFTGIATFNACIAIGISTNCVIPGTALGYQGPAAGYVQLAPSATGTPGYLYDNGSGTRSWNPFTTVQASVASSNVTMTTAGTYYDGPTTGSQAAGTWLIQGTVSLQTSATPTAAINFTCKLWDGTTIFSSTGAYIELTTVGATKDISLSLSAVATEAGAATFKISCTSDTASQLILYQTAYGSVANASSISAVRIK
jgi:hypothetical protein